MVSARPADEPAGAKLLADELIADEDANELMETRPICHHVSQEPEVP
jgi:hypothetical protein